MQADLVDRVHKNEHELEEQASLRKTDAFEEGVKATAERRLPNFSDR
jgi:hypothetical protein